MAIARIAAPFIVSELGVNSSAVQKAAVTEAASMAWPANSFVYTSGTGASVVLNACASDATACYGLCPDSAVGSGSSVVPNRLFGTQHYPFDCRDRVIEINAVGSSASGANIGTTNGVTWAGGGTGGVALAPGQQYGLIVPTSGTYVGVNFLDVTETTAKMFEILSLAPGQATTDNNPRVWVKILEAMTQL